MINQAFRQRVYVPPLFRHRRHHGGLHHYKYQWRVNNSFRVYLQKQQLQVHSSIAATDRSNFRYCWCLLHHVPGSFSKLSWRTSFILLSCTSGMVQTAMRPSESPRSSSLHSRPLRPNTYIMAGQQDRGCGTDKVQGSSKHKRKTTITKQQEQDHSRVHHLLEIKIQHIVRLRSLLRRVVRVGHASVVGASRVCNGTGKRQKRVNLCAERPLVQARRTKSARPLVTWR